MPTITRWSLRAGLLYLVAGLAAMAAVSAAGAGWLPAGWLAWRATALHLLTVGWLTQLIWGVAFWMFPTASRQRPHGREGWMAAGFVLLNVGLLLRVAVEPTLRGAAWGGAALAVSGLLQWFAALLVAAALWPRVRAAGPPR